MEVIVDSVGGQQKVVDAKCEGTMFRGFELLMRNRDPRDATHYTQRICGVCPIAHGMASSKNLESAFGNGEVHPADLKKSVAKHIIEILAPVREHLNKNPENQEKVMRIIGGN